MIKKALWVDEATHKTLKIKCAKLGITVEEFIKKELRNK